MSLFSFKRLIDDKSLPHRLLSLVLVSLIVAAGIPVRAESVLVQARIVDVAQDDIYVDIGMSQGLKTGDIGTIGLNGSQVARVQVMEVTKFSARLRILTKTSAASFKSGDVVNFHINQLAVQDNNKPTEGTAPPPSDDKFVPLLKPLPPPKAAAALSENIFHGRLRTRQSWHTDNHGQSDYSLSTLDSSGSIDRIQGSSLSLVWYGQGTYRDGPAFINTQDYRIIRLGLYNFALSGKFGDNSGFYRLGRFLPQELSSVGTIDGAQGEVKINDHFRVGNVMGVLPRVSDMAFDSHGAEDAAYMTMEAGQTGHLFYSGTLGYLETLFNGKPDRTAFLHSQRADVGSALSIYSTTEMDMDWTTTHPRGGTHLSRLNLYGNVTLTSFLSVRAGTDYYQQLDTQSERQFTGNISITSPGNWRYWAGTNQSIGRRLRFSEDISFSEIPNNKIPPHWQVSATEIGLPFIRDAATTLTVYNLYGGVGTKGYGGNLSSYFSFFTNSLSLSPSCGFRYFNDRVNPAKWEITDYSVHADLRLSKTWGIYGGVSQTFSKLTTSMLVQAGLNYRW